MATCHAAQTLPTLPEIRRAARRSPAALPVLLQLMGRSYSAKLRNLSQGGAMVEADLRLFRGDEVAFKCGAIDVQALVVWHNGTSYGLQFRSPIPEKDLHDQVMRADFLADRRNVRKALGAAA